MISHRRRNQIFTG